MLGSRSGSLPPLARRPSDSWHRSRRLRLLRLLHALFVRLHADGPTNDERLVQKQRRLGRLLGALLPPLLPLLLPWSHAACLAVPFLQETLAKKKAREDKMKELEQLAEAGGVKGMRAKAELEAMKNEDELERNKAEIQAGARRRAAQRAVDKGDPYAEEQKRLAEEKKKKEEEERKKKEESRQRLKERAKLWQ